MTDCESRVQAFAVAMREEAYGGQITERGRNVLEAVLREVLPKARNASPQACQSILVRLETNVNSLERSGEVKPPAGARLRSVTAGVNPPGSTPYPTTPIGRPASGGILQAAAGGRSMYLLLGFGAVAAGIVWYFLRKKHR